MIVNSAQEIGQNYFYVLTDSINKNICYFADSTYDGSTSMDCVSQGQ